MSKVDAIHERILNQWRRFLYFVCFGQEFKLQGMIKYSERSEFIFRTLSFCGLIFLIFSVLRILFGYSKFLFFYEGIIFVITCLSVVLSIYIDSVSGLLRDFSDQMKECEYRMSGALEKFSALQLCHFPSKGRVVFIQREGEFRTMLSTVGVMLQSFQSFPSGYDVNDVEQFMEKRKIEAQKVTLDVARCIDQFVDWCYWYSEIRKGVDTLETMLATVPRHFLQDEHESFSDELEQFLRIFLKYEDEAFSAASLPAIPEKLPSHAAQDMIDKVNQYIQYHYSYMIEELRESVAY